MEKDRKSRVLFIVSLLIGVVSLTMGFALFSSQLIIASRLKVSPDADSFKVVLSKEQNNEIVGNVSSTGDGEDATINNDDAPTISNLKANFVSPGEKVVYEFYAANIGEYDAFLNKIEFENIANLATNKKCIAGKDTTDAYVQSACNSIRVTVKVGEDDKACQTSTYGAHKLEKENGEKVVVTIEYDKSGARADGPFTVQFGDITLNYSTVDSESKNLSTCTEFVSKTENVGPFYTRNRKNIIDNNKDGIINVGDKVTLNPAESFYVMSTDETAGTVTMLSEWNLNVGQNTVKGTSGMQNSACKGWVSSGTYYCTLAFSRKNYWSSSVSTYPAWVYNNQSSLYSHVETYVTKLKEAGYRSVTGRLIKHEELVSLGCDGTSEYSCNSAPAWVLNTSFWSGSANSSADVWRVHVNSHFNNGNFSSDSSRGLRPVITINASEI